MIFKPQLSAEMIVLSLKHSQYPMKNKLTVAETANSNRNITEIVAFILTIFGVVNGSDRGIIPLLVKYVGNCILDMFILDLAEPFEAP